MASLAKSSRTAAACTALGAIYHKLPTLIRKICPGRQGRKASPRGHIRASPSTSQCYAVLKQSPYTKRKLSQMNFGRFVMGLDNRFMNFVMICAAEFFGQGLYLVKNNTKQL